jgi:signal transduction histidine kinase
MTGDTVNYLKAAPLLATLSQDALIDLAKTTRERRYNAGEVILREGETGDVLYVITQGVVDVVKGYSGPAEEVIATRSPGDVVGEMSLLEGRPRFATVVAREDVKVIGVPFNAFVHAIGDDPLTLRRMLSVMSMKLREARQGRYEDLKRRHEELAGLSRLQRAFIRVIHYELMSPVTHARQSMEMLRRELQKEVDQEERDKFFHSLESNLGQAEQRMRALVEYATLIEGQEKMYFRVINFVDVAKKVISKATPQAKRAKVILETAIRDESLWLPGDRRRLADAMSHLLDNGIRYNKPGGRTVVNVWWQGGYVCYQVADQGQGIPSDRLGQLWKPFTQISHALRGDVKGLGLGLALTQYIVKAHQGEVWAESEVGKGSRFGFKIPMPAR